MSERLDGLLAYLIALTKLKHEGDYICVKEIAECVKEIRAELDIGATHGEVRYDLTGVSTAELSRVLASRDGVTEHNIGPHGDLARLHIDKVVEGYAETIEGPARIIVNKD